jgi:hypothetical protein
LNIELTANQQQAIERQGNEPTAVVDAQGNVAYYLVPATEYETIRELLEEVQRQTAIRAVGLRNAGQRIS